MKLEDGLYIEEAGAVEVIHTNKSIRLPEGKNLTVFVELTTRHSGFDFKLPKPENSAWQFIMVMLKVNTEDTDVTINPVYLHKYTTIFTLDEPWDYMLFWSDGIFWHILNYNWSV